MADIVALHPTVVSRLKNILSVARDIEHDLGDKPICTNPPAVSITLPPPNDITDDLLNMGLPCASAQRLAEFFMKKCLHLRQSIEEKIKKYLSLAHCSPSSELQAKAAGVFEQLYSKLLAKWTSQTLYMAQSRTDKAQRTSQQTRRQFNQVFVLFTCSGQLSSAVSGIHTALGKLFRKESLPFPWRQRSLSKGLIHDLSSDRCLGMSEVFKDASPAYVCCQFQNRRSRAKKEGKLFKRPSVHDDGSSSDPDCVNHQVDAVDLNVREHGRQGVPEETVPVSYNCLPSSNTHPFFFLTGCKYNDKYTKPSPHSRRSQPALASACIPIGLSSVVRIRSFPCEGRFSHVPLPCLDTSARKIHPTTPSHRC
jgi:hypothetical protein